MKPVRFLRPAEEEFLAAVLYYTRQGRELAVDFVTKIVAAQDEIAANPERWPEVRRGFRRRLVHRFPYSLIYRVDADEIVIVATMHQKRRPDYWVMRVGEGG